MLTLKNFIKTIEKLGFVFDSKDRAGLLIDFTVSRYYNDFNNKSVYIYEHDDGTVRILGNLIGERNFLDITLKDNKIEIKKDLENILKFIYI